LLFLSRRTLSGIYLTDPPAKPVKFKLTGKAPDPFRARKESWKVDEKAHAIPESRSD
jgi:hypothetical protein